QIVALDAQGNAPAGQLSLNSLTFGAVLVGQTSGKQTVILSNTGSQTLIVTSVNRTGDFKIGTTCVGSIAPGGQCFIDVAFASKDIDLRQGSVTITDNAPDSPHTITLPRTRTEVKLRQTT